jgi:hypothetical protein
LRLVRNKGHHVTGGLPHGHMLLILM